MLLKIYVSLLCSVALALDSCVNNVTPLVRQNPKKLLLNPGETAIINCTVTVRKEVQNIYLRKRFDRIIVVKANGSETHKEYKDRLTYSGQGPHFTFMLKNLTDDDTDFYICDGFVEKLEAVHGEGTLIFVGKQEDIKTENKPEEARKPVYITPIIIAIAAFLFIFLAIFVFVRYKKLEKNKGNQSTYVDMTQTLRRNTMQSNIYCNS